MGETYWPRSAGYPFQAVPSTDTRTPEAVADATLPMGATCCPAGAGRICATTHPVNPRVAKSETVKARMVSPCCALRKEFNNRLGATNGRRSGLVKYSQFTLG